MRFQKKSKNFKKNYFKFRNKSECRKRVRKSEIVACKIRRLQVGDNSIGQRTTDIFQIIRKDVNQSTCNARSCNAIDSISIAVDRTSLTRKTKYHACSNIRELLSRNTNICSLCTLFVLSSARRAVELGFRVARASQSEALSVRVTKLGNERERERERISILSVDRQAKRNSCD